MTLSSSPRATVITAVRNGAGTLDRMLQSLAAQSYRDWEHVVVDDGSTDGTAALLAESAARGPRMRVIAQAGAGAAAARNRGAAEARGEWLLFLDADDTIPPRHLEKLAALAAADVDAVCSGHVRRNAAGRIVSRQRPPKIAGGRFAEVTEKPPVVIHAILLRRTLFEAVGGFDETLSTHEDWDLWGRLARAGARVRVQRETEADYWASPGSLTRGGAGMVRDAHAVLSRLAGPDARVTAPAPEFAGGFAGADPEGGALLCALWCVGARVAEGGEAGDIADALPGPVAPPGDLARPVDSLLEGLMVGGGRGFEGLIDLWPGLAPRLGAALERLAAVAGVPGLDTGLLRAVEREVVRTAGSFGRSRMVGGTYAVSLGPAALLRPLAVPDAARAVVVRTRWLRPRSWFLFQAPVAPVVPPGELRRRLIGQAGAKLAGALAGRRGRPPAVG